MIVSKPCMVVLVLAMGAPLPALAQAPGDPDRNILETIVADMTSVASALREPRHGSETGGLLISGLIH